MALSGAKLIHLKKGIPGDVLDVVTDEVTIGSDLRCHIRIHKPDVERQHCTIERRGTKIFLVSHSQTHPVLLNDTQVLDASEIKKGDTITVSNRKFTWSFENNLSKPFRRFTTFEQYENSVPQKEASARSLFTRFKNRQSVPTHSPKSRSGVTPEKQIAIVKPMINEERNTLVQQTDEVLDYPIMHVRRYRSRSFDYQSPSQSLLDYVPTRVTGSITTKRTPRMSTGKIGPMLPLVRRNSTRTPSSRRIAKLKKNTRHSIAAVVQSIKDTVGRIGNAKTNQKGKAKARKRPKHTPKVEHTRKSPVKRKFSDEEINIINNKKRKLNSPAPDAKKKAALMVLTATPEQTARKNEERYPNHAYIMEIPKEFKFGSSSFDANAPSTSTAHLQADYSMLLNPPSTTKKRRNSLRKSVLKTPLRNMNFSNVKTPNTSIVTDDSLLQCSSNNGSIFNMNKDSLTSVASPESGVSKTIAESKSSKKQTPIGSRRSVRINEQPHYSLISVKGESTPKDKITKQAPVSEMRRSRRIHGDENVSIADKANLDMILKNSLLLDIFSTPGSSKINTSEVIENECNSTGKIIDTTSCSEICDNDSLSLPDKAFEISQSDTGNNISTTRRSNRTFTDISHCNVSDRSNNVSANINISQVLKDSKLASANNTHQMKGDMEDHLQCNQTDGLNLNQEPNSRAVEEKSNARIIDKSGTAKMMDVSKANDVTNNESVFDITGDTPASVTNTKNGSANKTIEHSKTISSEKQTPVSRRRSVRINEQPDPLISEGKSTPKENYNKIINQTPVSGMKIHDDQNMPIADIFNTPGTSKINTSEIIQNEFNTAEKIINATSYNEIFDSLNGDSLPLPDKTFDISHTTRRSNRIFTNITPHKSDRTSKITNSINNLSPDTSNISERYLEGRGLQCIKTEQTKLDQEPNSSKTVEEKATVTTNGKSDTNKKLEISNTSNRSLKTSSRKSLMLDYISTVPNTVVQNCSNSESYLDVLQLSTSINHSTENITTRSSSRIIKQSNFKITPTVQTPNKLPTLSTSTPKNQRKSNSVIFKTPASVVKPRNNKSLSNLLAKNNKEPITEFISDQSIIEEVQLESIENSSAISVEGTSKKIEILSKSTSMISNPSLSNENIHESPVFTKDESTKLMDCKENDEKPLQRPNLKASATLPLIIRRRSVRNISMTLLQNKDNEAETLNTELKTGKNNSELGNNDILASEIGDEKTPENTETQGRPGLNFESTPISTTRHSVRISKLIVQDQQITDNISISSNAVGAEDIGSNAHDEQSITPKTTVKLITEMVKKQHSTAKKSIARRTVDPELLSHPLPITLKKIQTSVDNDDDVLDVINAENHSIESTNKSGIKNTNATKSPKDTVQNISGVKKLFTSKSPENNLTNVAGVRKLFDERKIVSPKNDLTNVTGIKSLFDQQRKVLSPRNDLTNVSGIKHLLQSSPQNTYQDISGVENLFKENTIEESTSNIDNSFDMLISKPVIKKTYANRAKSLSPIKNIRQSNRQSVGYALQKDVDIGIWLQEAQDRNGKATENNKSIDNNIIENVDEKSKCIHYDPEQPNVNSAPKIQKRKLRTRRLYSAVDDIYNEELDVIEIIDSPQTVVTLSDHPAFTPSHLLKKKRPLMDARFIKSATKKITRNTKQQKSKAELFKKMVLPIIEKSPVRSAELRECFILIDELKEHHLQTSDLKGDSGESEIISSTPFKHTRGKKSAKEDEPDPPISHTRRAKANVVDDENILKTAVEPKTPIKSTRRTKENVKEDVASGKINNKETKENVGDENIFETAVGSKTPIKRTRRTRENKKPGKNISEITVRTKTPIKRTRRAAKENVTVEENILKSGVESHTPIKRTRSTRENKHSDENISEIASVAKTPIKRTRRATKENVTAEENILKSGVESPKPIKRTRGTRENKYSVENISEIAIETKTPIKRTRRAAKITVAKEEDILKSAVEYHTPIKYTKRAKKENKCSDENISKTAVEVKEAARGKEDFKQTNKENVGDEGNILKSEVEPKTPIKPGRRAKENKCSEDNIPETIVEAAIPAKRPRRAKEIVKEETGGATSSARGKKDKEKVAAAAPAEDTKKNKSKKETVQEIKTTERVTRSRRKVA